MVDDPEFTQFSLKSLNESLVLDLSLKGEEFLSTWSQNVDAWLKSLFLEKIAGIDGKIALIAVGGYGRSQLAPSSDLDVTLVHDKCKNISKIADSILYPIWDQNIKIDHSVRTVKEALAAAKTDLRVALGLLDARLVAGDATLANSLIENAHKQWVKLRETYVPELIKSTRTRTEQHGELAFLLEPDLKESHGGLRDLTVISGLEKSQLVSISTNLKDEFIEASTVLGSIRVELHRSKIKPVDRLLLQEQDKIAKRLDYIDADELMADVARCGRTVAFNLEELTFLAERKITKKARLHNIEEIEESIGIKDDEVVLKITDKTYLDTSLAFRAACVATETSTRLSRELLEFLKQYVNDPAIFDSHTLNSFIRLLGLGKNAITQLETLDQHNILVRFIPMWQHVRNNPQRNAYHRYTVDRHLFEACANAAQLVRNVSRPDLLLIGTLFHDIGKGYPGDHSKEGISIVKTWARHVGFNDEDTDILGQMVEFHLLLPDVATRRDLDDPKTIELTAEKIANSDLLDLLQALTEADSLATGPAAWGNWKANLVAELVSKTRRKLEGHTLEPSPTDQILKRFASEIDSNSTSISLDSSTIIVVSKDTKGLLAKIAGALSMNSFNIIKATVTSAKEGMVIDTFQIESRFNKEIELDRLKSDILSAIFEEIDLDLKLNQRTNTYASKARIQAASVPKARVIVDNQASSRATVIEVRTADASSLLYKLASTLSENDVNIRSAIVSTLGHEVVDVFYVTDATGNKIEKQAQIENIEMSILSRLEG